MRAYLIGGALLVALAIAPVQAQPAGGCAVAGAPSYGHAITFMAPLPGWRVFASAPGTATYDHRAAPISRTAPLILPDGAAGRVVFTSNALTALLLCTPDAAPPVYLPMASR